MSLDGCFESVKPWSLDFHMTVWGDELEAFSLEQGQEIGTLLFGRRTYEGMAAYWMQESGPIADMMNSVEKAVATRTLDTAEWHNTRVLKGEIAKHIGPLKDEAGKDIFVFGSADLVASLLKDGLVDEYRICLAPVVLGGGTPLFKADGMRKDFALAEARPLKSGGVILRYLRKDE